MMPAWVPPNRGSTTAARLGGATRSAGNDALPRIEALVPQEAGWTLEAQPVLYWYLSKTTEVPIELVVVRVDPLEQVLKTTLPAPTRAGVQRIELSSHDVQIDAGSTYQWLSGVSADARAVVLARNGIWYDAIDDLTLRIQAAPGDRALWNQRAHLFQQVGLPEVKLEMGAADGFQRR
jgi:hypothetical protein